MIAKHVSMRSQRKSSYVDLVRYMCDPQSKQERVGTVTITNCHSLDVEDAVLEVAATQSRNVRCASDKTYHLILSFRAGEEPDAATLRQVEVRICAGLGYAEHQRISAVHHDTDNIHIHLAINKIHPSKLTLHAPFHDYKTLNALCQTLEEELHLEHDNHESQQRARSNRAADMEHAGGLESLTGWIQRGCLAKIQHADSWKALHQVMHENGLAVHLRGNGLVISDHHGTIIKASSVSRDISKTKLEQRLGPFRPCSTAQTEPPQQSYQPRPMRSRMDTNALYANFQSEQKDIVAIRAAALQRAQKQRDQLINSAKRNGVLKRAAVKLSGADYLTKKALYALTSKTLIKQIEQARTQYQLDRQQLTGRHKQRNWHEWLQYKAAQGNHDALQALRARDGAQGLKGNTFAGTTVTDAVPLNGLIPDSITKQGTLIYRMANACIRDDGKALQISKTANTDALEVALTVAMQRYGKKLSVNGTPDFKTQVAELAAKRLLPVQFNDPALEKKRLALLLENHQQNRKSRSSGLHR